MTSSAAAPLPVLYLPPPDPGMLADLLLHEVAACAAAVGHRLHVLPRPPGTARGNVREAVAEFSADHGREPVLVIVGRLDAGPVAESRAEPVPVATVTLDGTLPAHVPSSTLSLPARSRSLCRLLARSAAPRWPGRALVLAHHGQGAGGDDGWPGLSWGLTLLLGGPGRGVLVDLRGADGGLGSRLLAASDGLRPEAAAYAHAHTPDHGTPAGPVPGPALAARLPAAGGVRWWSMTGPPADLLPLIGAAVDTFPWTVLDVGRDARLAAALAAEGLAVLSVTGRDGTCSLEPAPRAVSSSSPSAPRAQDGLVVDPALWSGSTPASWGRAARRRVSIDLAARLTMVLSREPAEARR
jgi:hypothetical protein